MELPVIRPTPADHYPQEVDYDPITQRLVYIHVAAESSDPTSIHIEDWEALGLWAVVVPVHAAHPATIALDAFHWNVPIKRLDSVCWTVRVASSGWPLERDRSIEWYSMKDNAQAIYFIAHLG